jgi:hypothetical protein
MCEQRVDTLVMMKATRHVSKLNSKLHKVATNFLSNMGNRMFGRCHDARKAHEQRNTDIGLSFTLSRRVYPIGLTGRVWYYLVTFWTFRALMVAPLSEFRRPSE